MGFTLSIPKHYIHPMQTNWKRNTAIFLSSQTISLLGSCLVQYALMWHVTLETKSGLMMTLYVICGFLPTFIVSPFAGVLADRHDRRKLIVLADAMIALVTLALAVVFTLGGTALWLFFLAAAIRAVGSAVQGPAVGAFLPQLVPEGSLMRVSGINGSIQSIITLVSPALSGVLMTVAPLQVVFYIDVVTAVIAIFVILVFLRVPPHKKAAAAQTTSYFADMKLGIRYIKDHRYLVSFFLFMAVFLFLITPAAFLTPLQAARTFGPDVWRLTAIEICFSGGMMLGGVLIASLGGFRNRMKTLIVASIVMAVCTIALGFVPFFWLYLAVMAVFGVAMPFYNTPSSVMIQEHVEPEFLGRVFSVMTMLFTSMMPLGMLVFGPLAEIIKIEWLLLGTGALMLLLVCIVPFNKKLMEYGLKPHKADALPIGSHD